MNLRTPLGRVRGLGSASTGTEDFWLQRMTAIAGVPLTIAGLSLVISLTRPQLCRRSSRSSARRSSPC